MKPTDYRPRLRGNKKAAFDNITKDERRILVIGDLHAPFTLNGYLDFCKETYANYNCNQVIFIGDIIDNHYSSFHPTDPDGFGAGEELDRAIDQIRYWHEAFPNSDVVLGNHDKIILRKIFKEGISMRWVKTFNEMLEVPTWNFDK